MTKIDEKYMASNKHAHFSGLGAYRHDRLFIEVYNKFWHKFGCDTHLFNINLLTKLSDVFGVTLQYIYILNVASLYETIIPSCLHSSMQNIEQSLGLCRASRWSNVNVNQ